MREPALTGLIVGFIGLSIGFGLLETLWPSIPNQRRLRAGFGTDLAYWLLTPLLARSAVRLAAIAAALLIALAFGASPDKESVRAFVFDRQTWVTGFPKPLQALLALLIGDLAGYWLHRLFHGRRLWKFHAVHHGSTELDWLSAVRVHPVNEVLNRVGQLVVLLLLGFPGGVLAAYVPFLTLYAIGLHANVSWDFGPLRAVLASPRFHRWHHTSQEEGLDKNFAGLFPVWDVLFGTYHMPAGRVPQRFGVAGEPVPETLLAQLAYPFRRS